MNTNPTPALLQTYPLIDEILDEHRDHARGDEHGWSSYRGHVYRVFNLDDSPGVVAGLLRPVRRVVDVDFRVWV